MRLSDHFWTAEFQCKCGCGFGSQPEHIDMELIHRLEEIRREVGRPILITSGARCPEWNEAKGGKPNSAHLPGPTGKCRAADIGCVNSRHRALLLKATHRHFERIGVAKTFIHVDVAAGSVYPKPSVWVY